VPDSDNRQSGILKALADENRIRLLRLLSREVLNVQELCEILDLPQSRASRHLSVLRGIGLVNDQREGSRVYYSLAKLEGDFGLISGYLDGISSQDHPDLDRMEKVLRRRTSASRTFAEEQASHWDELGADLHSSTAALVALAELTWSDRTIADLGTGTGLLLPVLASCSKQVYAVDHSKEMLALAEERCMKRDLNNVSFVQCDLETLGDCVDKPIDCMLMHFVLHQLSRPKTILNALIGCLAPGGRIVVVDRLKHDDEAARERYGSLWMGFDEDPVRGWLSDGGCDSTNFHELGSGEANDPGIFIATGRKA
jgi:DNA-binding transcriptional ArsR family regulator